MALPINKKAQNFRQARGAGFKPGTAIRDDSGAITGGVKRKLPPLPSNPVKPAAGGIDPNSGVSSGSIGTGGPVSNPIRGIPSPVNPVATERGRGPGGPINDTPGMPPIGRPNGPMPQLPGQVKPIGQPPSGGIYAGGGQGGGMQGGSQGAIDRGIAPPGFETPGIVPPMDQPIRAMPVTPMQSYGPIQPDVQYAGDPSAIARLQASGGDVLRATGGQQDPRQQQMLQQIQQMKLPPRFGGNAQAAMQFLQQNPQSQFAQRFYNGGGMQNPNASVSNPMLTGLMGFN